MPVSGISLSSFDTAKWMSQMTDNAQALNRAREAKSNNANDTTISDIEKNAIALNSARQNAAARTEQTNDTVKAAENSGQAALGAALTGRGQIIDTARNLTPTDVVSNTRETLISPLRIVGYDQMNLNNSMRRLSIGFRIPTQADDTGLKISAAMEIAMQNAQQQKVQTAGEDTTLANQSTNTDNSQGIKVLQQADVSMLGNKVDNPSSVLSLLQ